MAEQAVVRAQADDDIFIYMGGDQVVPNNVRRVRIDKSVKIIPRSAFFHCQRLIDVEFHDGIDRIEQRAFNNCISLKSVKLLGVKIIGDGAFHNCGSLIDVEFGDTLETIGRSAFSNCTSLRNITMPSVRNVGKFAFSNCIQLTDLDLPEGLETIQEDAFHRCNALRGITMQLNCRIGVDVFVNCPKLTKVNLIGGIHRTVASLHLERWSNEIKDEINRINQILPNTNAGKTPVVRDWISSVIRRINHYKAEHKSLLKEATTLLELALWKANLDDNEGGVLEREGVRTTRGRRKRARKEICITSGANIVIKNVLPFLTLLE